jgi:hypothetical protein
MQEERMACLQGQGGWSRAQMCFETIQNHFLGDIPITWTIRIGSIAWAA